MFQHISYQKMKKIYRGELLWEALVLFTAYLAFVLAAEVDAPRHRCHITQRGSKAISNTQVKISGGLPLVSIKSNVLQKSSSIKFKSKQYQKARHDSMQIFSI